MAYGMTSMIDQDDLGTVKYPQWMMEDPVEKASQNMREREKFQLLMEAGQMDLRRKAQEEEEYNRANALRQNVQGFLRENPGAKEDDIYGAVQNAALESGDINTFLKIADQMSQREQMQWRSEREAKKDARAEESAAFNTFLRAANINPNLARRFADQSGLSSEYGFTPDMFVKQKSSGGRGSGAAKVKAPSISSFVDTRTGELVNFDINDPAQQSIINQNSANLIKVAGSVALDQLDKQKTEKAKAEAAKIEQLDEIRKKHTGWFGGLDQDAYNAELAALGLGGAPVVPTQVPVAIPTTTATTSTVPPTGVTRGKQDMPKVLKPNVITASSREELERKRREILGLP